MTERTDREVNPTEGQVEAGAIALWRSEGHALLERAGFATDWHRQPRVVKRDYLNKARRVIAAAMAEGGE